MIVLYDNDTGDRIGEITAAQLQILFDELEEASESDRDYYIHEAALELLEEADADDELVLMMSEALGDADGVEIRWEEEEADDDEDSG